MPRTWKRELDFAEPQHREHAFVVDDGGSLASSTEEQWWRWRREHGRQLTALRLAQLRNAAGRDGDESSGASTNSDKKSSEKTTTKPSKKEEKRGKEKEDRGKNEKKKVEEKRATTKSTRTEKKKEKEQNAKEDRLNDCKQKLSKKCVEKSDDGKRQRIVRPSKIAFLRDSLRPQTAPAPCSLRDIPVLEANWSLLDACIVVQLLLASFLVLAALLVAATTPTPSGAFSILLVAVTLVVCAAPACWFLAHDYLECAVSLFSVLQLLTGAYCVTELVTRLLLSKHFESPLSVLGVLWLVAVWQFAATLAVNCNPYRRVSVAALDQLMANVEAELAPLPSVTLRQSSFATVVRDRAPPSRTTSQTSTITTTAPTTRSIAQSSATTTTVRAPQSASATSTAPKPVARRKTIVVPMPALTPPPKAPRTPPGLQEILVEPPAELVTVATQTDPVKTANVCSSPLTSHSLSRTIVIPMPPQPSKETKPPTTATPTLAVPPTSTTTTATAPVSAPAQPSPSLCIPSVYVEPKLRYY